MTGHQPSYILMILLICLYCPQVKNKYELTLNEKSAATVLYETLLADNRTNICQV